MGRRRGRDSAVGPPIPARRAVGEPARRRRRQGGRRRGRGSRGGRRARRPPSRSSPATAVQARSPMLRRHSKSPASKCSSRLPRCPACPAAEPAAAADVTTHIWFVDGVGVRLEGSFSDAAVNVPITVANETGVYSWRIDSDGKPVDGNQLASNQLTSSPCSRTLARPTDGLRAALAQRGAGDAPSSATNSSPAAPPTGSKSARVRARWASRRERPQNVLGRQGDVRSSSSPRCSLATMGGSSSRSHRSHTHRLQRAHRPCPLPAAPRTAVRDPTAPAASAFRHGRGPRQGLPYRRPSGLATGQSRIAVGHGSSKP